MYSYITVLSNWLVGYDRYTRLYSKENISQSTYPNEFYLLKDNELNIGFNKAKKLINKVSLEGNKIIRIDTSPEESGIEVFKNERNGLGWLINENKILVKKVYLYVGSLEEEYSDNSWEEASVEDLNAMSLLLDNDKFKKYDELFPLTFSFLPVGIACQAKCKFCFSKSSISNEKIKKLTDFDDLLPWMRLAKDKGAQRFVITGGGDPGLFGFENLSQVISLSREVFDKAIMFSNGIFIEKNHSDEEIIAKLKHLKSVGLSVFSLSVHHYEIDKNTYIMGINTKVHRLLNIIKNLSHDEIPTIRLICVIQNNGISNSQEINNFLSFAIEHNIPEVCFKELYVASTKESLYADFESNNYSKINQVSLKEVINYAIDNNHECVGKLPWGSPIYKLEKDNKRLQYVAYTEPNVGWERINGIARSWNYMSDKKCYASLEDTNSILSLD